MMCTTRCNRKNRAKKFSIKIVQEKNCHKQVTVKRYTCIEKNEILDAIISLKCNFRY